MSVVDNYVLKASPGATIPKRFIALLNKRLFEEQPTGAGPEAFVCATAKARGAVGGPKYMEMDVYLGALNYVGPVAVVAILADLVANHVREFSPHGLYGQNEIQLFCQTDRCPEAGLVQVYPKPTSPGAQ